MNGFWVISMARRGASSTWTSRSLFQFSVFSNRCQAVQTGNNPSCNVPHSFLGGIMHILQLLFLVVGRRAPGRGPVAGGTPYSSSNHKQSAKRLSVTKYDYNDD